MSLAAITLPTNKSMTLVNNNRRTVRQDEKGLSIVVTILDANGADYDLTGKDLEFCERKVSSKIVVDDGTDQDSDKGGKFELDADNKGMFTYTLPRQAYAASGTCWFTIKQGDSVIDTTKDFYLDVDDEASINLSDDNYASSFEAQLAYYKSLYSKANDTLNADHQQYVDGLNEYKQNFDDLKSQWQQQTSNIQTAANQQIADAQKAASDQLTSDTQAAKNQRDSEASTFSSTLQDQVNQIESARDAAIKAANDAYAAQRTQLASDFANWEKQQQDSWTKTLADIQAHVNELQNTDIPGMDAKVKDLQANIAQAEQDAQDATAKFNSIDITKYELKSDLANDYYTKTEVDGKMGQKITFVKCNSPQAAADASSKPAADGSIVFGVYDMNDEPSQAVVDDQKIDIEWLYNHLDDLQTQVSGLSNLQSLIDGKANSADVYTKVQVDQMIASAGKVKTVNSTQPDSSGNVSIAIPDISGKADKTDVSNLQSMITGLSTKVDSLKQNSLKIVPITQTDYDALSDDDKANGMYAIGDSN